jgi:hypothetical protein
VTRAVEFGLKRLKIRRAGSVLRCLGAKSWDEVRQSAARAQRSLRSLRRASRVQAWTGADR